MLKEVDFLKFCLVVFVCILSLSQVLAVHNISGKVLDALSGDAADGKNIFLWNTLNGPSDNLSDVIGAAGNSGTANNYTFDCELLSTPCGVGDNLSIQVFDSEETFSEVYTINVTENSVDYLGAFRLDSRPFVEIIFPTTNPIFDGTVLFNCSYNDLDSDELNVTIFTNETGSFEPLYSELGFSGNLEHSEDFSDGTYSFYCSADDNLLLNSTATYEFGVNNSFIEVKNVSINNYSDEIVLAMNDTVKVSCVARVYDSSGEDNITNVKGVFFDSVASFYSDDDDNNFHYTNSSCYLNKSFGSWNGYNDDSYHVLANCTFDVWYYSNASGWNCSVNASGGKRSDLKSDNISILELLAFNVPDSILYGGVIPESVSGEKNIEIENVGNVALDVELSGFAQSVGDDLAMNCSSGVSGEINLSYEKYNLTQGNPGDLSFSEFDSSYKSLGSSPVLEQIDLDFRKNDFSNEAKTSIYWRIFVPKEAGGTCEGNVFISAVKS